MVRIPRGDALRFASHLPLAFIFRAVGALMSNHLRGALAARAADEAHSRLVTSVAINQAILTH